MSKPLDLKPHDEGERKIVTLAKGSSMNKMVDELAAIIARKIPGVSLAAEVLQCYSKMRDDQLQNRFLDFVMGIRDAELNIELDDLTAECFDAIVTKLLRDDEKRKTKYYTRLAIGLAKSGLGADDKIYYINTLSELTGADIDFAKKLYISQTIPLCGYTSLREAEGKLTSSKQGIIKKSLRQLINYGLLEEDRSGEIKKNSYYNMTDELANLVSFIFSHEELDPQNVGEIQKEAFDVIIVDHMHSVDNLYIEYVKDFLTQKKFSVGVVKPRDDFKLQKTAKLYINNVIARATVAHTEKEFIQIWVARDPDTSSTKLVSPDRAFSKIEMEIFCALKNSPSNAKTSLLKSLTEVAEYTSMLLRKPEQ
ncbi:hypothetical protein [Winslowiella toletana]|uniref:hypothetical protein n=1 Tax=Winslowiella toletana TaxID=92490 RepID=UPI0003473B22|nr:hypothetical protein [Winslowiella toletana]